MSKTTVAFALLTMLSSAGRAEIAVFPDGRSLKIAAYSVGEETLELTLPAGGKIILPIDRVDRIIDDEVMVPPEELRELAESAFPQRS